MSTNNNSFSIKPSEVADPFAPFAEDNVVMTCTEAKYHASKAAPTELTGMMLTFKVTECENPIHKGKLISKWFSVAGDKFSYIKNLMDSFGFDPNQTYHFENPVIGGPIDMFIGQTCIVDIVITPAKADKKTGQMYEAKSDIKRFKVAKTATESDEPLL